MEGAGLIFDSRRITAAGTLVASEGVDNRQSPVLPEGGGLSRLVSAATAVDTCREARGGTERVCQRLLEALAATSTDLVRRIENTAQDPLAMGQYWERWEDLVSQILVPDEESLSSNGEEDGCSSQRGDVHGSESGDGTRAHPYRLSEESD